MSDIYLHNTLTGKKEKFVPIKSGEVTMYNCGPTVYNYAHIGNIRSYVFADVLRRMFEYNGYKVKQVINITDIGHLSSDSDEGEDKMTKALKREGKPMTLEAMREVANFYFEKFKEDLASLNIEMPSEFPFASEHVQEDIDLIEILSKKGFTYQTSDGIYFDISKFPDYGKLGNINISDEGESRIGVNSEKRNTRDFAVWKFNSDLGYDTPFGKGFPGWHIECSAMSMKYLGSEFDIHTGGIDHIPIHHNNEIAQAVCAGNKYAHYWMHNAFLNIVSGKMAKSGDNFITLQTLKDRGVNPLAYRYLLLTARYSSQLQFSWEALEGAGFALNKIITLLSRQSAINRTVINDVPGIKLRNEFLNKFATYINNDMDTPQAIALIWEVIKDDSLNTGDKKAIILDFDRVLGLGLNKVELVQIPKNVRDLIESRDEARKNKDFAKSDEIRNEIEKLGFEVKDTPDGTIVNQL